MTSLFLLDDTIKTAIADLVAKAEKNVIQLKTVEAVLANPHGKAKKDYLRQMRRQTLHVLTYAYTFSFEEQPTGRYRHLSVSVERKGRVPLPQAIDMVLPLFGFKGNVQTTQHWLEELGNDRVAINFIEPVQVQ